MKLYRYEAIHSYNKKVVLSLQEYKVAWETPCGYWIYLYGPFINDEGRCPKEVRKERPHEFKFVLKTTEQRGKKRFAYSTKEEALKSYKARKRRRVEILEAQLKRAKREVLANIEDVLEPVFCEDI